MAKELTLPDEIAFCHAISQACIVAHTPGHTFGFPIYERTGFVLEIGYPDCVNYLKFKADFLCRETAILEKL